MNRLSISSSLQSLFPDNNIRDIQASDVRGIFGDIVESTVTLSGSNILTGSTIIEGVVSIEGSITVLGNIRFSNLPTTDPEVEGGLWLSSSFSFGQEGEILGSRGATYFVKISDGTPEFAPLPPPSVSTTPSSTPSETVPNSPTPTPSSTPSETVPNSPTPTPTNTPPVSNTPTVTPSISVTPTITPSPAAYAITTFEEYNGTNQDPQDLRFTSGSQTTQLQVQVNRNELEWEITSDVQWADFNASGVTTTYSGTGVEVGIFLYIEENTAETTRTGTLTINGTGAYSGVSSQTIDVLQYGTIAPTPTPTPSNTPPVSNTPSITPTSSPPAPSATPSTSPPAPSVTPSTSPPAPSVTPSTSPPATSVTPSVSPDPPAASLPPLGAGATVVTTGIEHPTYERITGSATPGTQITGEVAYRQSTLGAGSRVRTGFVKDTFAVVAGSFTPAPGHKEEIETMCSTIQAVPDFNVPRSSFVFTDCGPPWTNQTSARTLVIERDHRDDMFKPIYSTNPDPADGKIGSLYCGHNVGTPENRLATEATGLRGIFELINFKGVYLIEKPEVITSCLTGYTFINSDPDFENVLDENQDPVETTQRTVFTSYSTY